MAAGTVVPARGVVVSEAVGWMGLGPLFVGPISWLALCAVIGFGCAGIFVTAESWLSAKAPLKKRDRVFSIYMVGTFVALALGQLLIGRVEIDSGSPFSVPHDPLASSER